MRIVKRSQITSPKVSLVLVDWSVRESFHLLHYLNQQTIPRNLFEVTFIEYYDRISEPLKAFENQVDNWIVLDLPKSCYYHKHLMYNAGIVFSSGDIIMIGDSDAMVESTFIETIIEHFEKQPRSVFHIDQFRNIRPDFYPFNYPSFQDVLGYGCINNAGGMTTGIRDLKDPIHSRNYGACMCARRDDLIAIGGADMHIDYLGHICGPYDMTFRLVNNGLKEVWSTSEFTYHTWHPGQAGTDNYLGPHDGRHMSTTSLEALSSGRVKPLLENPAIASLRSGDASSSAAASTKLIDPSYVAAWDVSLLAGHPQIEPKPPRPLGNYRGFHLVTDSGSVVAYPIDDTQPDGIRVKAPPAPFDGADIDEVKRKIDGAASTQFLIASWCAGGYQLAVSIAIICEHVWLKFTRYIRRVFEHFAHSGSVENMQELAISLYNMSRWGKLRAAPSPVAVIVEQRRTERYLRMLGRLRLLPQFRIVRAEDMPAYQSAFDTLQAENWSGLIVVSAKTHERFYAAISGRLRAKGLIIV